MDGERFDGIARGLTSARSRRGLLAGLAALIAGAGLGRDDATAQDGRNGLSRRRESNRKRTNEQQRNPSGRGRKQRQRGCLKNGTRCSANSGGGGDNCDRCCSRTTAPRANGGRRCACRQADATCTQNRQCCSKQCFENVCLDCADNETACPSAGCVNLQTDDANCGSCGTACTANEICDQGACEPLPCGAGGTCTVFVTSVRYAGNLGGLAGADVICQALAAAAGSQAPAGTYKAWLSDSTTSAAARLYQSPEPYVLVDRSQVAADWAALTSPAQNLEGAISLSETGVFVGDNVWTNTNDNGTQAVTSPPDICTDWTSAGGSPERATIGLSPAVNSLWTNSSAIFRCSIPSRLYCFQQA